MSDAELLRRYVETGSQDAFTELVRLRIGLVYSAALRLTHGDAHRARDVTQIVFSDLARKAPSLCHHRALVGWLFTSARYAAATLARSERRRLVREQEAHLMHEDLASPDAEIPAERLRPLLDDALHQLTDIDRRALLLRFFDGCSMAELGGYLDLSESTAKKRVERALEKLRVLLAKR
ncbi:MAG: polymerase, sigma-24 subunit, subfamily, partial [Verrucomicrobia bacterium]|nr:polymerase, sigma-24 subunit, subfamily [Verrucomicrobiota bacterium]